MSIKKVFLIFNRETKLYFAGLSKDVEMWAQRIEAAIPYYSQKEADEEYERLKEKGFDVMVEG